MSTIHVIPGLCHTGGLNQSIPRKLFVLARTKDLSSPDSINWIQNTEFYYPFGDGLLDYEFELPENTRLPKLYSTDLFRPYVVKEICKKILEEIGVCDNKGLLVGEVSDHIYRWYTNYNDWPSIDNYRERSFDISSEQYDHENKDHFDYVFSHLIDNINIMLATHREGAMVFSNSKLASILNQEIFSVWPRKLFEPANESLMKEARELWSLGEAFSLPLVTSIVLSRARNRMSIPNTIIEMREEYQDGRKQLWDLMEQLMLSKTRSEQRKIVELLKNASQNIWNVGIGDGSVAKLDGMKLAIDLASGRIGNALHDLRSHDVPNVLVSSVTFCKKISIDIGKLESNGHLLKKHLTNSEMRDFGIA